MFRSSNPLLRDKAFGRDAYLTGVDPNSLMTVGGTINRALVLFATLVLSALAGAVVATRAAGFAIPVLLVGVLGGFALALVVTFNRKTAPILAPAYAVLEGLALGVISTFYEAGMVSSAPGSYRGGRGEMLQRTLQSGIVFQAVVLTMGVFGLMLLLYKARLLRATPTFTKVVVLATGAIFVLYLVNIALRAFGVMAFPFLHEGTPLGILFSVGVCALAAMNFILDFDFIERGANSGAPKYMEWYAGFSLLVTMVWLYLEILRLLNKVRR